MKVIKYRYLSAVLEDDGGEVIIHKTIPYSAANEEIVKKEAYGGEYTIEDDGVYVVAPRNIVSGEYITVSDVLYKATENIPNGERIIAGQNAIKTTVEAQLYELMGG